MSIHECRQVRPREPHLRHRRRRVDVQGLRRAVPRQPAARHPHPASRPDSGRPTCRGPDGKVAEMYREIARKTAVRGWRAKPRTSARSSRASLSRTRGRPAPRRETEVIKIGQVDRRMAAEHRMIEARSTPGQCAEVNGRASSPTARRATATTSRCSAEFKIFTNINSTIVDPKAFDAGSFVDFTGDVCIIPPNSFAARAHRRILPHSAERAHDLPRQEHLRALRHHRQT